LFLQAVGRVLRTHPGKEYGFLVDLTDNTARFGTDLDNIKVTVPKVVADAEAKERSMWKICPNCDAEVHIALRECSECGFVWPETECVVAESLPDMKSVTFEKRPNEWKDVVDWEPSIHESAKTKKTLGRIDYFYHETDYKKTRVSMFLCFPDQYSGYAVTMSQQKWSQVSDEDFPVSVDEFGERRLFVPVRVEVDLNGKYPDLVSVEVDESQFVYPVPEFEDDDIPF
jgi:hypothetical protein